MSCPICSKPTQPEYRPFCSRRCANVDLQRWLTGGYVVPASDDEDAASVSSPEGPEDDD